MQHPIDGMTTIPYGVTECPGFYMGPWVACLMWAATEPAAMTQFEQESGLSLLALLEARGVNALIDQSTGRDRATIAAFADFVTRNYWGEAKATGKDSP